MGAVVIVLCVAFGGEMTSVDNSSGNAEEQSMNPTATIKPDLIKDIIATIKSIPEHHSRGAAGDTKWTSFLKSELRKVGKKHGYLVSPCPDDDNKEWLYDLIWFRNDPINHQLCEVALVLESEWSRDAWHIQEDFEKLLVAKAPIKVMVFQNYGNNLPVLWRLLEDGIRIFEQHTSEETYILAAFKEEEHEFEIRIVQGVNQEPTLK